ncbi:MAG TPA: protein kinase [Myxococcaceae bacterium]|nr:protein kinase [Myxococcaceae bacterium]
MALEKRTLSHLLAELAASPRGVQNEAWEQRFRPGDVVADRFELLERIGRGGFGVVFRARDRKLNRFVAFKAIPPGGFSSAAIQREAEIAAQLEHEGLVRLYDYGLCDGGAYLLFDLLTGETLEQRLSAGPLPPREAIRIALEVTRALVFAHARGVLHRDLKPANVFLTHDGKVKVLDFGLAYYFGQGPERSGTPGYMAPEQARGGPEDVRTDVHGVGLLLREMVSGQRPGAATDGAGVPGQLADLVRRATDPDPAGRPASAIQLAAQLEALARRLDGGRWTVRQSAFVVVGLALAGAIGLTFLAQRPRLGVVVADLDNATGDPELDGVGELVRTSLEQWPRLLVLPRQRVLALAGAAAGKDRVDCGTAQQAARQVGATAVLCGNAMRSPAGYELHVQVTGPKDDRQILTVSESARSKDEIPALVDRLSGRTHRTLAPWSFRRPISAIAGQTTQNLEAYRHYFDGLLCADRPVHGQDCSAEFREALRLDPGFALAAYQLAVWLAWNGGPLSEQRALIGTAARLGSGAPEKERTLIRAWSAHLAGADAEALGLLRHAAQAWPQDKQVFYQAGDILRHRNELSEAVHWFEGAIALDPQFGWALGHLAQALGALGRTDELRAWAARWEAAPSVASLHGLSVARGWLGDVRGAAEAAQQSLVMGAGVSGQEDLLQAKLFAGDYPAVEEGVRLLALKGSPVRRIGYYGQAALEAYQGRPRAGLAVLDRMASEIPELRSDAVYHTIRADYLVGMGDRAAVKAEVELARALDPNLAAEHAVSLAYLGDFQDAEQLARGLPSGTQLDETAAALILVGRDSGAGLEKLQQISARAPIFAWRISPVFLHGERLAAAGRDEEAIKVLRRAQRLYVPVSMWRSWAFPRSQVLLARALRRTGRLEEARQTVDRLLSDWRDAEPDAPLLAEARALRAELSAR